MVGMGGSLLDGESGVCYRPRIVVTLRGATASFLWTKGEEKKPGVLSSSDRNTHTIDIHCGPLAQSGRAADS